MGVSGGIRVSSALFAGTVSFLAATREERAEVFFVAFCAPFGLFTETFLFAFFNGDMVNFYSWSIDVARVTGWNGHQDIQSLDHLAKDTVFVI